MARRKRCGSWDAPPCLRGLLAGATTGILSAGSATTAPLIAARSMTARQTVDLDARRHGRHLAVVRRVMRAGPGQMTFRRAAQSRDTYATSLYIGLGIGPCRHLPFCVPRGQCFSGGAKRGGPARIRKGYKRGRFLYIMRRGIGLRRLLGWQNTFDYRSRRQAATNPIRAPQGRPRDQESVRVPYGSRSHVYTDDVDPQHQRFSMRSRQLVHSHVVGFASRVLLGRFSG